MKNLLSCEFNMDIGYIDHLRQAAESFNDIYT